MNGDEPRAPTEIHCPLGLGRKQNVALPKPCTAPKFTQDLRPISRDATKFRREAHTIQRVHE
jgi:hypothetical protein